MRIKRAVNALKKRRKIMRNTKGYFGAKHRLYRVAKQQLFKSGQYSYIGRKLKKRDFRKSWIARINDLSYSRLMHGLKMAGIELNRKVLSDIAVKDKQAFAALCESAKKALK